ncbi:MAG: SBBP repeat-containing protein [Candidatus Acidiferrales bacterium]
MRWAIASCILLCLAGVFSIELVGHMPGKTAGSLVPSRAVVSQSEARSPRPLKEGISAPAVLASHAEIVNRYGKLPMSFEPNMGQSGDPVKFLARGNAYTLFLTPSEAVFALKSVPAPSGARSRKTASISSTAANIPNSRFHAKSWSIDVVRMRLVGANPAPLFAGEDELPGKSNYLIGNQPAKWHTNIPNYLKVSESEVYPGIDLLYYGTQRQLEYDFSVAPGVDPRVIQFAFQGATKLRTGSQGELIASIPGGDVRLQKPVAYQQTGDVEQPVAVDYGMKKDGTVAFVVGNYDSSRTLVIDPILAYSTYLGGSGIDVGNGIAVATDGTAFIAGATSSSDFPTAHPLQPNAGGGGDLPEDAFVSKLSADGSTLLYSTYLGGENEDLANGVAVDTFGNAYVTGTTNSPNFPVTPDSYDLECGGDSKCGATWNTESLIVTNAFVSKLNTAGSALVYSTFLGVYENVEGNAIAVDSDGNAYVTGQTTPNFVPTVVITPPALPPPPFPIFNGFQTTNDASATNAFVTKFTTTGQSISYSSYLGGSFEDSGHGIAVDSSGNAYITGVAYSTDFPTANPLQPTSGGAGDAFLTEVNTNGSGPSSLLYSTFLGGAGLDQGNAVAVDSSGNAYVAGTTSSTAFGFTAPGGAFQPACALDAQGVCEGDAFVAKLNPAASGAASIVYFTYLGGSLADTGNGIAVDTSDNAYITGSTVSLDFPVTSTAFQPTYGGGNADAYVTKLDPLGATLVWSSYLGGTNTDIGTGIAADATGSAYVTGQTCSLDFPLSNPLQSNPGGNCDAFISKVSVLNGIALNPAGLVFPAQSLGTTSQPLSSTLTNGETPLTISGITLAGDDPGDFAVTNTCGSSVAAGAQCTITATFTPTASGTRRALVMIADSAPGSPQVLSLTGPTSTITLSASSLSFGTQSVGVPSSPQAVTVTNNGTTALTISSIVASGDFSETDDCTKAPLQPTTQCEIDVTYTPSAPGATVGALTITDNAAGSPQVVLLNGTGLAPGISIVSVPPGATVSAGQTATFTLLISSVSGFVDPIQLGCGGIPPASSCSFSPGVVTLAANSSTTATVSIKTGLRTLAPPSSNVKVSPLGGLRNFGFALLAWLVFFLILTITGRRQGLRATAAAFGLVLTLLMFSAACGNGSETGVPAGTPAGPYQITIVGTSGSVSGSTTINLQVN